MIKDSGDRTEYETGAVRDLKGGKGRCDLLPLTEVAELLHHDMVLFNIAAYQDGQNTEHLKWALENFILEEYGGDLYDAMLDLAKHFEEGAQKYTENNWKKGIPEQSYIDSAIRHYLKHKRGDDDERHDRAFMWNVICLWWTHDNKPTITETTTEKSGTGLTQEQIDKIMDLFHGSNRKCSNCVYWGNGGMCFMHDNHTGGTIRCEKWKPK